VYLTLGSALWQLRPVPRSLRPVLAGGRQPRYALRFFLALGTAVLLVVGGAYGWRGRAGRAPPAPPGPPPPATGLPAPPPTRPPPPPPRQRSPGWAPGPTSASSSLTSKALTAGSRTSAGWSAASRRSSCPTRRGTKHSTNPSPRRFAPVTRSPSCSFSRRRPR